ncbi:MAG: hypothetical protein N3A38_10070 [Planctomycetota bacterium]|nr:hypothetical protein [Planctomycetota bacterium]
MYGRKEEEALISSFNAANVKGMLGASGIAQAFRPVEPTATLSALIGEMPSRAMADYTLRWNNAERRFYPVFDVHYFESEVDRFLGDATRLATMPIWYEPIASRISGAGRCIGGGVVLVAGVGLSKTGVGAVIGVPAAFWAGDQVGTGVLEICGGGVAPSLGSRAATAVLGQGAGAEIASMAYDILPPFAVAGVERVVVKAKMAGPVLTPRAISRGEQLREMYGQKYVEYARFREQGFSPAQSLYLTHPYKGTGHHFPLRQELARKLGLPESIKDSPLNVLKPSGISVGRFYELHYQVDPAFHGARFPRKIGGIWAGSAIGLQKYSFMATIWHGTSISLKIAVGTGVIGGSSAGVYWLWEETEE